MGVFEGKALYFCRGGGDCCFSVQWVVVCCENVSKMQFCGYPLFKYLVVCSGLNTKKNEKKTNYSNSLEGGSPEKKKGYVGGAVD